MHSASNTDSLEMSSARESQDYGQFTLSPATATMSDQYMLAPAPFVHASDAPLAPGGSFRNTYDSVPPSPYDRVASTSHTYAAPPAHTYSAPPAAPAP